MADSRGVFAPEICSPETEWQALISKGLAISYPDQPTAVMDPEARHAPPQSFGKFLPTFLHFLVLLGVLWRLADYNIAQHRGLVQRTSWLNFTQGFENHGCARHCLAVENVLPNHFRKGSQKHRQDLCSNSENLPIRYLLQSLSGSIPKRRVGDVTAIWHRLAGHPPQPSSTTALLRVIATK